MLFFEDLRVGDKYPPSRRRVLTQRDIDNWCDYSGDWYGHWAAILSDEQHFIETKWSPDRQTAPALLVVSLQYSLSHELAPWRVALYQWEQIEYIRPLRVGDTFYFEAEFIHREPVSEEYGVVKLRRVTKNQRGDTVLTQVDKHRARTRSAWEKLQKSGAEPLRARERR